MSSASLGKVVPVTMLAAACFMILSTAQAQQASWGVGRTSASSWGTSAKTNTSQTTTSRTSASTSSSSSSWIAGKGSFGSTRQPGGVWRDSASKTANVASRAAKTVEAESYQKTPATKRVGLSPAAATVRTSAPQGKTQNARAPGGVRSSTGAHFGASSRGKTGPFNRQFAHRNTVDLHPNSSSDKQTKQRSGFGATSKGAQGGSSPATNPFAVGDSGSTPGSGSPTDLGGTPH